MKNIRLQLIVTLFCLACTFLPAAAQVKSQPEESWQRARDLWEKAIEAKGGREQLYKVSNIAISTRTRYQKSLLRTGELQHEQFCVIPHKCWFWTDERAISPVGLSVQTIDRENDLGYLTYPNDPESPRKLVGVTPFRRSLVLLPQLFYLMETPWLKPKPVKARTEWVGLKKVDVVEVLFEYDRFYFYLDRKTHLPVRVVMPYVLKKGTEVQRVYTFDDYVNVGGIKLPRKVNWEGWQQRISFEVNAAYDEETFERPPKIERGPDAWRK